MSNIAFLWDNFGPTHIDECEALAAALPDGAKLTGIELFSKSGTYGWGRWQGTGFEQVTLFDGSEQQVRPGTLQIARKIVQTVRARKIKHVFFCHYQEPYILLSAWALRLLGCRLYVLSDSKFDDYPRHLRRELGKSFFMTPYHGALTASLRCKDYIRFLGVNPDRIRRGYYSISMDRVRAAAGAEPAPGGLPHGERHFLSIARLVPKKNHVMLVDAYARYKATATSPRKLILCGSGPLEADIRERIAAHGLEDWIEVRGNVLPADVATELGRALCLLLPSIEEQFGIVVLEAQALGLPVIVSDNVGARDVQVRTGVNGFVVEPDNPEGMAYFMRSLSDDETLWRAMATEAGKFSQKGDIPVFVDAALELIRS
ncbi:glycosyltransferase family 4 protein [Sphingomonas sp. HITSZ_GF]|uniref:glycosyltransferase family 4 protein n=1 Tax=Sphingomonas sp. HITSZ_GF TaxID=3037247 RepID=UPI00240E179D|nr:glycosyltransferase family 4 protein [Sphingomonas sp. HITSZ_GF]MDG2535776.1 glycosyltransferase family 4 protein [Sphingomonas sp. HITSZ_GF]